MSKMGVYVHAGVGEGMIRGTGNTSQFVIAKQLSKEYGNVVRNIVLLNIVLRVQDAHVSTR